jgi:dihydroorotate dehydrogenase electron transfer subunit
MKQTLSAVASNAEIIAGIHLMEIEAPDVAAAARPGQFITVRCGDLILCRPFSIHQVGGNNAIASPDAVGAKQSQIAILFKVAGKGTLWLSQRKAGEKIDILGPLGNGFAIAPESRRLLLVAGGVGIAPLVFLTQQTSSRHQITLIHGASTGAQLYPSSSAGKKQIKLSPLPKGVQFIPVTEDGSAGKKGMATHVLPDFLDWADQVCACGPVAMYKTMADMSLRVPMQSGRSNLKLKGEETAIVGEGLVPSRNLKLRKCQISLEVRMGCGFGACYGCTINTKKGLKQVCLDGPVFELDDIIWQEVRI